LRHILTVMADPGVGLVSSVSILLLPVAEAAPQTHTVEPSHLFTIPT
jgi:hypothetical protein